MLTVAVAEFPGKPAAVLAAAFAKRVEARSGGAIRLEVRSWPPRFPARTSSAQIEAAALADVRGGDAELAVLPTSAFEAQGVEELRALRVPFLLDSTRIRAATQGTLARRLESGLPSISLRGLALVPDGFERPFGFLKALATPADFAGVRIRADASPTTRSVLRALGAQPVDLNASGTQSGVYSGFVSDASAVPLADDEFPRDAFTVSNLALFPRVDLVVASARTFDRLRPWERSALERAAADVRLASLRPEREQAAAEAYCRAGGSIVVAKDADLRKLRAAVAPVLDDLRRAPASGALVRRFEQLPSGGAGPVHACAAGVPDAASVTYPHYTRRELDALRPPQGSYRRAFTVAQLREAGAGEAEAERNAGVTTLTFRGPPFALRFVLEWQSAARQPCRGIVDFPASGVELRWNPSTPCSGFLAFRWTRAEHGDLVLEAIDGAEPAWVAAAYRGIWRRVDCAPDTGWPGAPYHRGPHCSGGRSRPLPGVVGPVSYDAAARRAVFARTFRREAGIWIARTDGGAAKRLTHNRVEPPRCPCDRSPSFAPDGRHVAFVRTLPDHRLALFVVASDGGRPVRVTSWSRRRQAAIRWSSNGPHLE